MYRFFILLLSLVWAFSVHAQEEMKDTTAMDSLAVDSLEADTLLQDSLVSDSTLQLTVQQRIEKLLEADMFHTSQIGMMIYDLTADSLVFAYNERQTMRPASTMKLLTAITALDRLGGSYRYSTTLSYSGTLYEDSVRQKDHAVLVGNVTVKGGMDPRFSSDDMNAFVESLQKLGIDTIYGEIREDRSFKDTDLLGEGWCWDDNNPVLTPLPWNRKDYFLPKFQQTIREKGIVVRPQTEIPRDSLNQPLYTITQHPSPNTILCTRNHTIDQILVRMMKESDNLYAESMLYQIASSAINGRSGAKAKNAITEMKQLIRKVGLDPDDYRIADGSGLSLYNYQSAELQCRLLRYAWKNTNIYGHLYPSLPVAGVDGTLKKRMRSGKACGNVHAKTGTLTGISSLSGYLTAANGNTICFSIINQGIRRAAPAKTFQDKVCTIMCNY